MVPSDTHTAGDAAAEGRGDSQPNGSSIPRTRSDRAPRSSSSAPAPAPPHNHHPSASSSLPAIHDRERDRDRLADRDSAAAAADARPAKRARKAINCEPCRTSKLKCDRTRPCSSCVLRGTTASCYTDAAYVEEHGIPDKIDPVAEFARARQSLALLEAHFIGSNTRRGAAPAAAATAGLLPTSRTGGGSGRFPSSASAPTLPPLLHTLKEESPEPHKIPGILAQQGTYTGPTSTAMNLLDLRTSSSSSDSEGESRTVNLGAGGKGIHTGSILSDKFGTYANSTGSGPLQMDYDRDLIEMLPHVVTIDELIDSYFRTCNWVYRHVNELAFRANWTAFKDGQNPDRIILAQACVLMAISIFYLPLTHTLLAAASGTRAEVAKKYYEVMHIALKRHFEVQPRTHTLEMVELLLSRTHYMYMSKSDAEEQWQVRGELVSMGTSMGLHRDPGNWKMSRELAERRRWAWWHIILLERWTAFTLGRPLAIAAHHYDTRLPATDNKNMPPGNDYYHPNISLLQLARCLGEIMDDAVSVRPVPYESIMRKDKMLQDWYDGLPECLKFDDFQLSRALASTNMDQRRLGVQSIIVRVAYFNIRFTLHRPHAVPPSTKASSSRSSSDTPGSGGAPSPRTAELQEATSQSLQTAVRCGGNLIKLLSQASPDVLAHSADDVPGHLNWGPFHLFSAAMFFLFQLIADPDQPGAALFRDHIKRALSILEEAQARNLPVAAKALGILRQVEPLSFRDVGLEKERKKKDVLDIVRSMAFPCHDTPSSSFSMPAVGSSSSSSRQNTANARTSSQNGHRALTGSSSGPSSSLSPDSRDIGSAAQHLNNTLGGAVGALTSPTVPQHPNGSTPSPTSALGVPQYGQSHPRIQGYPPQQHAQHQHQQNYTTSPYAGSNPLSHATTHPPPPHPLALAAGTTTSLSYQYQSLPPNPYANMPPPQPGPIYTSGSSAHNGGGGGMPMDLSGPGGAGDPMDMTLGLGSMNGMSQQQEQPQVGTPGSIALDANWGHTVGLGPEQWAQLLDVMQRPDSGGF